MWVVDAGKTISNPDPHRQMMGTGVGSNHLIFVSVPQPALLKICRLLVSNDLNSGTCDSEYN